MTIGIGRTGIGQPNNVHRRRHGRPPSIPQHARRAEEGRGPRQHQFLLDLYPGAAKIRCSRGRTPLFCACRSQQTDPEVLERLVALYPHAIKIEAGEGILSTAPLHLAVEHRDASIVVKVMLENTPKQPVWSTEEGNTPSSWRVLSAVKRRSFCLTPFLMLSGGRWRAIHRSCLCFSRLRQTTALRAQKLFEVNPHAVREVSSAGRLPFHQFFLPFCFMEEEARFVLKMWPVACLHALHCESLLWPRLRDMIAKYVKPMARALVHALLHRNCSVPSSVQILLEDVAEKAAASTEAVASSDAASICSYLLDTKNGQALDGFLRNQHVQTLLRKRVYQEVIHSVYVMSGAAEQAMHLVAAVADMPSGSFVCPRDNPSLLVQYRGKKRP